MTLEQISVVAILLGAMGLFLWGRWRHDAVAMGALLACVGVGVVPAADAFDGFGHPAVITVACVLVLSYGLRITGAVDVLVDRLLPSSAGPAISILSLTALGALLSGFMNNVGALALLMPAAIQIADRHQMPHGKLLMPLAFGSILGGTTTLIGTPPNLIISGFRAQAGTAPFVMFDFTPVGAAVAALGVLFVGLAGWRLVPEREKADTEGFTTGAYFSEVRVPEGSPAAGMHIGEVEEMLEEADAQILGMIRNDFHVAAPNPGRILKAGDILVIEADPEALTASLSKLKLELEEAVPPEEAEETGNGQKPGAGEEGSEDKGEKSRGREEESVIRELVVVPDSSLAGLSATNLRLRTRFGINLLAISRKGRRSIRRLRSTAIKAGDVLLVQGAPEALTSFASFYDCLPLATRDISVPDKAEALAASLVMAAAVASTALGFFPAPVSFAAGALAMVLLRIVPLRAVYTVIDWPVIILLAAMLPVAGAMASTGVADLAARLLLEKIAGGNAVTALGVVLASSMVMSDFMNNAATAAVVGPIALSASLQLGVNADTFLMAAAIGASCAFLTPIGHQNNTLILGPGGFSFGDYWRMGLPTDLLVITVAIPMLLWVWPL